MTIEEMPDDWDPEEAGFRELTEVEEERTEYILRYLVSSGKYYPTVAEEKAIKISTGVSDMLGQGFFEEKVENGNRFLRLLQKGFVNPYGWTLSSPFRYIIWKFFMEKTSERYNPLYDYIHEKGLRA